MKSLFLVAGALSVGLAFGACSPGVTPQPAVPAASSSAPVASAASSSARPKISLTGGLLLPDTASPAASVDEAPLGPAPPCVKDDDCWSRTCCPATTPSQCVHASLAKGCALKDVACKKAVVTFTCFCDAGACKGRAAGP
ncbi:MAG: hypothetical protein JNL79_17340 [Myxococcales bacterium]|nr:hypothetical protein [Myxococcales bacterium]